MRSRVENDELMVLPGSTSQEPAPDTAAGPPAVLVAACAVRLGHLPEPRRTLWETIADAARRVRYGPPEDPLTDEEVEMILRRAKEESDALPELVPPDDPERLAWEAHLRSIGVRPAAKWAVPARKPLRRPSLWERIKYRVSRGW
jgi:hypothetical protein